MLRCLGEKVPEIRVSQFRGEGTGQRQGAVPQRSFHRRRDPKKRLKRRDPIPGQARALSFDPKCKG
jgi:hypothetical protein